MSRDHNLSKETFNFQSSSMDSADIWGIKFFIKKRIQVKLSSFLDD